MQNQVLDTGISVVYESQDPSPVADFVIVHGLHGHPYKSWTAKVPSIPAGSPQSSMLPSDVMRDGRKRRWRKTLHSLSSKLPTRVVTSRSGVEETGTSVPVFWPVDLLPQKCPRSRVLVFGYDSKITKYMAGATNKGSLLAHSRDLLYSLCRNRPPDRPIIFVAHSLGGLILKEMLAISDTATEQEMKNVVKSTAAIVFLGTPHRGSPDLAAMGEYLRSIVSGLHMETTSSILDALCLRTTDLERAQVAFSRLWQEYDFRVKTFQEGLGMSGISLGVLTNKVVPDYSSLIGDHRERCETLEANHKNMCRFAGDDDQNCQKVLGELSSIYLSLLDLYAEGPRCYGTGQNPASLKKLLETGNVRLRDTEKACLESLWFPSMSTRLRRVEKPAEHTCSWLFEQQSYRNWSSGRDQDRYLGLIWLRGHPGSGKSTLMKEAYSQHVRGHTSAEYCTAAVFLSTQGSYFEHSPTGLLRSLMYQLLPRCPGSFQVFQTAWAERQKFGEQNLPWEEEELKEIFHSCFTNNPTRQVFIFIDALDECGFAPFREQAYFWRGVTAAAYRKGTSLNVCISSRHFPTIQLSECPMVFMERNNQMDILKYVEQRLEMGAGTERPQWRLIRDGIAAKSAGIFLWAVLVVDDILLQWDNGRDIDHLIKLIDVLPEELEELFSRILFGVREKDRRLTLRLFQWVAAATQPLRVHEWHHILAFIRDPVPSSLAEWRASVHFTKTDDQLERQIRSISKGLVEINSAAEDDAPEITSDILSIHAGAGSLNFELGETRAVQFVHESIREFFVHGKGFEVVGQPPDRGHLNIGDGHLSVMATCLDYLELKELDALVAARARGQKQRDIPQRTTSSNSLPNPDSSVHSASTPNDIPPNIAIKHSEIPQRSRKRAAEEYEVDMRLAPETGASSAIPLSWLQRRVETEQGSDVRKWLGQGEDGAPLESLSGLTNSSVASSLASGQSRLLEDYPALLSYATYEFFTHARMAQDLRVPAHSIVNRLSIPETWDRLRALKEDIPEGISMSEYVSSFHDLESWIIARPQNPNGLPPRPPDLQSSQNTMLQNADLLHKRTQYVPNRIRRPASVASFSSASSHTGSVRLAHTGS